MYSILDKNVQQIPIKNKVFRNIDSVNLFFFILNKNQFNTHEKSATEIEIILKKVGFPNSL